jgi:capsular polysaccharide biosynthesis protein/Mrp family chromosome partitioning ATPase
MGTCHECETDAARNAFYTSAPSTSSIHPHISGFDLDYARFVTIAKRWYWLLLGGSLLAAAAAWGVSQFLPKMYESQALVLVGSALTAANADTSQMDASRQLAQTYADVATTRPILQQVLDDTQAPGSVDTLRDDISVVPESDSPILTIKVTRANPGEAAAIANSMVANVLALSPQEGADQQSNLAFIRRQLATTQQEITAVTKEIDNLSALPSRTNAEEQRLNELQLRLSALQTAYASFLAASSRAVTNQLTVVEEAVPNPEPASPKPVLNALLGVFVGLFVAFILALLFESMDKTMRSVDDIERLGFPALGAIPRLALGPEEVFAIASPQDPTGAPLRALRANIERFAGGDMGVILVTSPTRGDATASVASSLAVVFARSGRQVILADASLEMPSLHQLMWHEKRRLNRRHGLGEYLQSPSVSLGTVIYTTRVNNLRLIPAGLGLPKSLDLVGTARMTDAIEALRAKADVVVLRGPSLDEAPETPVLASVADLSLLIVHAGRTNRASFEAACETLRDAGARLIAGVLYGTRLPPFLARSTPDEMTAAPQELAPTEEVSRR